MSRRHEESYEYFELLRHQAREEVKRCNWEAALAACARAITWAEELGDRNARDLAHCNRASILIAQGHGDDVITTLRRILLSSVDPEICHQAAYNVSRFHEMRKENQRGLFYARLSLDHARRTSEPEPIARSYNQIGLILVRQSYFDRACDCYTKAMSLLPLELGIDGAIIIYNQGFCHIMLGRSAAGFTSLFRSLRSLRSLAAEGWEMFPRLGLSFAYLEIDRPERAAAHARRGLLLAQEAGIQWQIKNALYLLGEAEKLSGNELAAHHYFSRLQQEFYPDDPVIPDFLMVTDVRKLINLMA